ncbi:hypothetical protein [Streptomyces sp. NPDC050263]
MPASCTNSSSHNSSSDRGRGSRSSSGRWRCGYVHLFVNKNIKLYRADK